MKIEDCKICIRKGKYSCGRHRPKVEVKKRTMKFNYCPTCGGRVDSVSGAFNCSMADLNR